MVAPHLLAGSLTYGPPVRYALPLAQNDPRGGEVTGAPKYDDQKFVGGVQENKGCALDRASPTWNGLIFEIDLV